MCSNNRPKQQNGLKSGHHLKTEATSHNRNNMHTPRKLNNKIKLTTDSLLKARAENTWQTTAYNQNEKQKAN